MYQEKWDKMEEYLNLVLNATERNMKYLFNFKDSIDYSKENNEWSNHYLEELGIDKWEPLIFLGRHFIPFGEARKMYTNTLEKYCMYFYSTKSVSSDSSAFNDIRLKTEKRLRKMIDLVLDDIEILLGELDADENKLLKDKDTYEKMLDRSFSRCHATK